MNDSYSTSSDVRARGRAADPRTPAEQDLGRALANERTKRTSEATSWRRRARRPRS